MSTKSKNQLGLNELMREQSKVSAMQKKFGILHETTSEKLGKIGLVLTDNFEEIRESIIKMQINDGDCE
jgi:hypothetical protein